MAATQTKLDWEALARASVHPLRLAILELMQDKERRSPKELADLFGAPIGNVSYHVTQLREQGLLRPAGKRQRRGAIEHYYRAA